MSQVPTGDWGRSASLDMHVYSESVPSVSLRKKDQATEFLYTLSLEYFLTGYEPGLTLSQPIAYRFSAPPNLTDRLHTFERSTRPRANIMTDSTIYTCKYGSTPFLSASNYHSWKNNISNLLAMDDSLDIVLGTELAPAANANAQGRDFCKRSQRAFGMIWSSTEHSIRTFLNRLGHRDPHIAWEALRERYDAAASQSARVATLARLHSAVMKPGTSVSNYISSLSDISQELEGTPDEVTERYLIMRILATLPEEFANIVEILKNRPIEEQTLNSVSTILIEHETARALRNATTGSNLNLAGTSSNALTANANSGKYRRTGGKRKFQQKPYNQKQ